MMETRFPPVPVDRPRDPRADPGNGAIIVIAFLLAVIFLVNVAVLGLVIKIADNTAPPESRGPCEGRTIGECRYILEGR